MKSKRKVLLALTINKQYFIRGVVRYAREHDWYLDMGAAWKSAFRS